MRPARRRGWGIGLLAIGVCFWLSGAGVTAAAPASESWISGIPFRDLLWSSRVELDGAIGGDIALDPPFERNGARYDLVRIGPEPGVLWLTNGAEVGLLLDEEGNRIRGGPVAGGTELRLEVLAGVHPAPGATIQVREDASDGIVVVRWVGFQDLLGHPATFEAQLLPGGALRYQYLQVPPSFRLPRSEGAGGALAARVSAGQGSADPIDLTGEGFAPAPGESVLLPPHGPGTEEIGCGQDPNWCTVAEQFEQECTLGSRQQPGTFTPCSTTQTTEWHFNENQWCWSCPYTYYIVVECGTEMHLPFYDMEGVVLTITDVFTGVQLELEALNDCARQPFNYCDNCQVGAGSIIPEGRGNCFGPLVPCEPFLQTSNLIGWGTPLSDTDGDGVGDSLPCGPANVDDCPLGATGSNPAHQLTVTDVMLVGKPGLCGVFRLDIISGGYIWDLFANCDGTQNPAYNIYSRCEDALADFDPLPELVITDFAYSGVCPDITLEVEVTNIGCADAVTSPLSFEFERQNQGDIDTDLGRIPVSTSVVSSVPVSLDRTPQTVDITVDSGNGLVECSEVGAGGATFCIPQTGVDSRQELLCACTNNPRAEVAEERVFSCGGEPVEIDAGPSTVVPCTGASQQFRFLSSTGMVLQNWSTDSTMTVTPTQCPSLVDYIVETRCSSETGPDCTDATTVQVECSPNPTVSITLSDNDVCQGETVTLDAGSGFAFYQWSTQETTRSIEVTPSTTTVYDVNVLNSKGCPASGQAEVRVVPDQIPPPLGNVLRVERRGDDLSFLFPPLAGDWGPYELAGVKPAPCPSPPSPSPTPFLMETGQVLDRGASPLTHTTGATACPDLIFYKVRATSECSGSPGPFCDGFPTQVLPCP